MQDSRFEKLELFNLSREIGSEEEINLAGMSSVRKLAHKIDTIQFSGASSRERSERNGAIADAPVARSRKSVASRIESKSEFKANKMEGRAAVPAQKAGLDVLSPRIHWEPNRQGRSRDRGFEDTPTPIGYGRLGVVEGRGGKCERKGVPAQPSIP